ncbi:MAG: hypothetical protein ACI83Q_000866, partial [Colwellia polaris]
AIVGFFDCGFFQIFICVEVAGNQDFQTHVNRSDMKSFNLNPTAFRNT